MGMRDFKKLNFKIYIFPHPILCAIGLDFILTGHQGYNVLTAVEDHVEPELVS